MELENKLEKHEPAENETEKDDVDDSEGEGEEEDANVDAALKGLQHQKTSKQVKKITAKKKKNAKSKAKRGMKGKEDAQDGNPSKGLIECVDFKTTISTSTKPPSTREKHALDDFLLCLSFAKSDLKRPISDEESNRTKRFLISMFLELAWLGSVSVNGKTFKVYSTFRDEAQKVFWAAHQKLNLGSESFDPLVLASNLLKMVDGPVLSSVFV